MYKYEVILYWNQQDVAFLAELPGCVAHSATQLTALDNVNKAIELWLDIAQEFNDPIPEPKGRRLVFA